VCEPNNIPMCFGKDKCNFRQVFCVCVCVYLFIYLQWIINAIKERHFLKVLVLGRIDLILGLYLFVF